MKTTPVIRNTDINTCTKLKTDVQTDTKDEQTLGWIQKTN